MKFSIGATELTHPQEATSKSYEPLEKTSLEHEIAHVLETNTGISSLNQAGVHICPSFFFESSPMCFSGGKNSESWYLRNKPVSMNLLKQETFCVIFCIEDLSLVASRQKVGGRSLTRSDSVSTG